MSNFLAVDTSSGYLTVAAVNGDKEVKRFIPDCALNHSVVLMGEIDKALDEAGLRPADCDFFAAVTGPGSFTGIRIGISTVKGLAAACNKPCLGVTAFDLAAYNINSQKRFITAVDAGRGFYYACGYEASGETFMPPCYITKEETESFGLPIYGFGDYQLPVYSRLPAGDCLIPAVKAAQGRVGGELHALYIRKSQAEENRK